MILLYILAFLAVLTLFVFFVVLTGNDRKILFDKPQTLTHDGIERSYRVRLPKNYDKNQRYPVVFAFHGLGDQGKHLEFYSGLSNLAQEQSFIAIYPEGIKQSWNGGICCDYAEEHNIDDVGFVKSLLASLHEQYSIDDDKIYATGFSNGGVLVARLIQELPDTFAGAAMVMSSFGVEEEILPLSDTNTSLLIINGTKDKYVPPTDNSPTNSFKFITLEKMNKIVSSKFNCANDPAVTENDKFIHMAYDCDQQRLETYLYKDIAHTWPGWRVFNPLTKVPESTKIIWDFLHNSD